MAGTDTPWARLDQTFAFQGSDDDDVDENGSYGDYHGYEQDEEDEFGGRGSRKGSVMTITISHEQQYTPQEQHTQQYAQQHAQQQTQQQYHRPSQQQHITVTNNTHHRTATTSTTSTASTITPANAGHQYQISQVSTQPYQPQQQHQQPQQHQQQHRPRSSLDEQYATKPLPALPPKKKLQKSASSRSSSRPVIRPVNKPKHQSQPSASSIASSVSSFNIPIGSANEGGVSTLSSLTRVGSVSAPTTLLRPAQSSAGWFSSAAQQKTFPKETSGSVSRSHIEPRSLTPLDLPPLTSPPTHVLLSMTENQNTRPITPLAQPLLMAPLALPPLKPRSRGGGAGGSSSYPSHLPVVPPRSAPHGDTVSLFSVHSMNSTATSTGAGSHNNARDDSSSMYSERRIPAGTAKHSPSLPSLSSFASSSSRLKPAAAAPGKAVRKFIRMAGKAASSAKGAMKVPLHAHSDDSMSSIGAHSFGASGTPSITVTTPIAPLMLSPAPSSRPPRPPQSPQSPLEGTAIPAVRPTMVARRRSMSKIRQLTGLDVGAVSGGSSSGISTAGILRRSQSTDMAGRGNAPNISSSSASSASNVPTSAVFPPTSTTATTTSIWNTSMFNSDDENDEDGNEDTNTAEDCVGGDEDSIRSKSMSSTAATAEEISAGDTPDPAMASLLRSLSQTSTQPPPVMPRLGQLGQLPSPPMPGDHQRMLLPPNRLLKIKRYSDPTMAPIIEHPDDTSNPSGSNSSRTSSHYSDRDPVVATISNNDNDDDAATFIPSRPAPVPVRSPSPPPSPPPIASPTHPSILSLTLFPPAPSISAANIAKHIPTIRLFPSSADSQASIASPISPTSTASSPAVQSPSAAPPVAPLARKNTLPTSNDISNPWPTSPPPRPPPPPPLHPIITPETEVNEDITEVAEKRLSGNAPNSTLFRTVQWGDMSDPSRTSATPSSSASTVNRLSLHARTKSNGSASESIATSIATSVANSSTSGSSALSSTVASTIASSSRSAGFGSFSSASTASNRHSYQLATPPMPPPPPNYPLPPLPASALIPVPMSMSMSMPAASPSSSMASPPSTQSAFDEDDEEISARMMAARMMKKAASRDSVRWRPTALGKSLFRREGSPGPSGSSEMKSTSTTPGIRSSLSTRSSLSATTLLAAQKVAQATRKTVEAVSEGGSGSGSAARQHELEMEKRREDLRSRIRMIPEGGELVPTEETTGQVAAQVLSPTTTTAPQPKMGAQVSAQGIRPAPVHEVEDGGMI